jgi:hypothetical protein
LEPGAPKTLSAAIWARGDGGSVCADAAAWVPSEGCSLIAAWKMARASGSASPQSFSNSVTSFFSKLRLVSGATFLSMMPTMSLRSFWQLTSAEK